MMQTTSHPNDLPLTCHGMISVNWDCSNSDISFVSSENKVCQVHSILAEFLSPKVARLRRCDISFEVYTFQDSQMFDVFESLVLSLRSGEALQVEKSNIFKLVDLCRELENEELLSSLLGMIDTESLSPAEAILLFRIGIDLGTAFSDRLESLRDFIASRFYELEKGLLDILDLETIQLLLSSPSLQLKDEDSLYDFVRSRTETDLRFTSLFEFVYFDYLSVDRIEDFVNQNSHENINSCIWSQICRRLVFETNPLGINPREGWTQKEFVYDQSKPLEGVIAHLTRECGGNVHDKGIVNATASTVEMLAYQPKNVADLERDSYYESHNLEGSWICYDFKERRVIPTSYTVRSIDQGSGWFHLRSWVIQVSNDGRSWTEIDRRTDNNDLNGARAIANFKISNVPCETFRFVRLKTTGKNHCNWDRRYRLIISALEVFGTLFER